MYCPLKISQHTGYGLAKNLNPFEHLWDILKQKVKESRQSNIHIHHDVIMKEWGKIPVETFKPIGFKAVHNNGANTKYEQFGHNCPMKRFNRIFTKM